MDNFQVGGLTGISLGGIYSTGTVGEQKRKIISVFVSLSCRLLLSLDDRGFSEYRTFRVAGTIIVRIGYSIKCGLNIAF